MLIKLTEQGKKRVAGFLLNILTEAQQLIDKHLETHPAKDPTWSDINFKAPTCHLCTQNDLNSYDFRVADSLSGTFVLSDSGFIKLKPCLVYPVDSIDSYNTFAFSIAFRQHSELVPEVLRTGIKKRLKQLGLYNDDYGCGYNDSDAFIQQFTDAGFSYTAKTRLFIAIKFTVPLDESDYISAD